MPILLHSWCCCKSIKKGSFVCGFYTLLYYSMAAAHASTILHEKTLGKKHITFLSQDMNSNVASIFTIFTIVVSSVGLLTCGLLLYGLCTDNRTFLIPWIVTIIIFTLQDTIFIGTSFIVNMALWNPTTAFILTIELFIATFNLYAALCVISQYQQLKVTRGGVIDYHHCNAEMIPTVQYSIQPELISSTSIDDGTKSNVPYPSITPSPTGTVPSSEGTEDVSIGLPIISGRKKSTTLNIPENKIHF